MEGKSRFGLAVLALFTAFCLVCATWYLARNSSPEPWLISSARRPAAEEPAPAVVLPQREKAVQAEPEEAEEAVPAFSAAPPEEEPEEQEDPFAGGLDGMDGEEEDLRDTRILNLDDLQFGRNYNRG